MRISSFAMSLGLGLAAACSRGLGDGSTGSCRIADPSLAMQAQIEAMQEGISERDVTQLNSPRVVTLEGVQCLRQLRNLDVEGSPISDLSPLAGHPALEMLFLAGATLRDLSPLGTVPHLQRVEVSDSGLESLDGLAGGSQVTRLMVDQNPIASLAGVGSLPALTELSARQTQVDALAPLAGAGSLARLDIAGSPVTDLAPLARLTALTTLSISQTAVSDLSPLASRSLQSLRADDSRVTDLTPLAASRDTLYFIDVSRTGVTSLAPLSGFAVLGMIYAANAGLTTLEGLHDLPRLHRLVVSGNAISDLSPLTALQPLWLDLSQISLDDAALGVVQSLCAAGWAVKWNDQACGNACLFESCTI